MLGLARKEHAWLLRAEGLTYREIGARLGVSRERARQMVASFGWRVTMAVTIHWMRPQGPRLTFVEREGWDADRVGGI